MKHWWVYSCAGAVWQSAMLVAFVLVSRTSWSVPGKDVVLALFCLGAGVLLALAGRWLTPGQAALMALGIGIGTAVVEALLGFTIWPGLAKDWDFWDLPMILARATGFLSVVYWACTMAFWVVWKLAGRAHWGRTKTEN
jgi:hypothetical protein